MERINAEIAIIMAKINILKLRPTTLHMVELDACMHRLNELHKELRSLA